MLFFGLDDEFFAPCAAAEFSHTPTHKNEHGSQLELACISGSP